MPRHQQLSRKYERLIGRPVADYRRTYLVYRRRWRTTCERHGLTISQRGKPDTDPLVPDLSSVRIGAAVDTLKPSWGRLGRVRDLQRRRESCRFAPSVGRDRRRGKGQNGAEQGQIARRRARCISTEGRPRPRNPRSWARCAATVVVMAALPGLASVGDCKRTLNYE
jgi:hypothetical protein